MPKEFKLTEEKAQEPSTQKQVWTLYKLMADLHRLAPETNQNPGPWAAFKTLDMPILLEETFGEVSLMISEAMAAVKTLRKPKAPKNGPVKTVYERTAPIIHKAPSVPAPAVGKPLTIEDVLNLPEPFKSALLNVLTSKGGGTK